MFDKNKKISLSKGKNTCKHMETKVAEAIAKWGNWNIIGVKCIFKEIKKNKNKKATLAKK